MPWVVVTVDFGGGLNRDGILGRFTGGRAGFSTSCVMPIWSGTIHEVAITASVKGNTDR